MKFLCDQCKAKYQIADEKVAGKTVRMKCRKCGHMIEVKSEVTETSVAGAFPPDDATRVGAADPAGMMHVTAPRPTGVGAPRPGAPAAPRAPASKLAGSLAHTRPSPASRPPPSATTRPDSALAGAFQKSVQKEEALHQIATNTEWYVAINGVPVGPIRLTELRRKAAAGAISDDSLCWQDGMEEWRPLKSVTELSAIVHEALAGARPSLASPAPVDSHPSLTPAPPRHEPSRPMAPQHGQRTPGPSRAAPGAPLAPAARSNVVSLSSRLATAERLEPADFPEDHTVVGDPFAALAPEPSANALPLVSPAQTGTTSQPIAPVAPPFHFPDAQQQKKPPNWIAIAMIVLAGAFGITAAIALFVRPPPAVAPVATATASGAQPLPTAATSTAAATIEPTATAMASSTGDVRVATGGGTNTGGGTKPAGTASAKPTGGAGDIASLLGGPTTGPNVGGGGGGGGGGGSALSQEAIEGVVRSRTPGVKRTCWERGGGTESNVNVTVKLVISSGGGVSSATATGNDPIVTKCIENQTRAWQFPASNGSTNVDIPFHFLRQ